MTQKPSISDDPEHQAADADEDRHLDAVPGGRVVEVLVVALRAVVDVGPDEDEGQRREPEQRQQPREHEALGRAEDRLAVVHDAGQPGEAVVEGDHEADRGDGVAEHVLAELVDSDVPDDRDDAHAIVETVGVCQRGETLPNVRGSARQRAIERLVRAVGRIVVCVDAAAELRTAMISSLSSGEPKTFVPRTLSTSSALSVEQLLAAVGLRREGDGDVDPQQQQRAHDRRRPGPVCESSDSSLTATPLSQPQ